MSDVNGAAGASKSAKQKFSNPLRELVTLIRKISDREIGDLDQLINDKKDLEQKIQSKNQELDAKQKELTSLRSAKEGEIAKLRLEKGALLEAFEERVKNWGTEASKQKALEDDVAELESQLRQAQDKASFLEGKLSDATRDLSAKEADLGRTKKEFESCKTTLQKEREELGLEHLDHEALITQFNVFVARCHELAKRFFLTQLPEDLTSEDLWTDLQQSGFCRQDLKNIPMSNTVQSQYLRMAMAEKVLANKLCTNVFLQYYLPDSNLDRQTINEVLTRLSRGDPGKEAIFRLQLLYAYAPEEEELRRTKILERTLADIVKLLDPLLFGPNARNGFRSELGRLLRDGVELWRPVQRSATAAQVDNDPVEDWAEYRDYDTAVALTQNQAMHVPVQSDAIMSLFPRVSIGSDIICRGYALWSSQTSVVAANVEYNQLNIHNSASGRTGIVRRGTEKRRLSLGVSSGGSGRMEDVSTSPKSPPENQSFLGRINHRKAQLL